MGIGLRSTCSTFFSSPGRYAVWPLVMSGVFRGAHAVASHTLALKKAELAELKDSYERKHDLSKAIERLTDATRVLPSGGTLATTWTTIAAPGSRRRSRVSLSTAARQVAALVLVEQLW